MLRLEAAGANSAACSVCRRVFTLMKTGLDCTHGPVDNRCSGSSSGAPPATKSGVSQPLRKAQLSTFQGDARQTF